MGFHFVNATIADKDEILHLYKSCIGQPGCAWTDTYPTEENIDYDLSRNSLFVYKTDFGEIAGTISIDYDENVEKLTCWSKELAPGRELSRVGVKTEYQNKGLALKLFQNAMKELVRRGFKSAHYLVAAENVRARKAYDKLKFTMVGETDLYGEHYICYEKELDKK